MPGIFPFVKQRPIQVLLFGYLLALPYWAWINVTGQVNTVHNYFWSIVILGLIPVLGGLFGISLSRKWGFLQAALGRAIFFLSCGVIAWGTGSLIWGYYNLILGVPVPYPSLGDVGYVLSYPFYALGLINLSKGMGAFHKLKTPKGRFALILIPILGITLTYFIFISIARGGELADFTGSSIILLFIGQFALYLGDFFFSYGTTQGTYYIANLNDLLFVHALLLIAISVNAFNIPGISSRVRAELVMFAPRASEAINNLVSEIIQRQSHIIGAVAWDEAAKVPGLIIDVKNNTLYVEGDPRVVLEKLTGRYEELFGNASREICREAARKFISQVSQEQIPEILR